jgi:adenylate cyclase
VRRPARVYDPHVRERGAPMTVDDIWREKLTTPSDFRWRRRIRSRVPSAPRCKLCAAPFGSPGSLVMPFFHHGRWPKNPNYCNGCFRTIREMHGGAEIDCSLLFADVRGSTSLGERMAPADFNQLMRRFFDVAAAVLIEHEAIVDKYVGDEIVAVFVPAMAGPEHPRRALHAAREVLRRTGHTDPGGPWLPIGVGVNSGTAWVGSVGAGDDSDFTAMGDLVNTTARLASAAAAGEILIGRTSAERAGLIVGDVEGRSLELKGKAEPTDVVVVGAGLR